MFVSVACVNADACEVQKRVSDPPEPEFQVPGMDAGTYSLLLCKNSKFSLPRNKQNVVQSAYDMQRNGKEWSLDMCYTMDELKDSTL